MPDDLKISVSAPGAKQAAADIAAVAGAEKAVAAAAAGTAPAHAAAAEAIGQQSEVTDELRLKNVSMLRELAGIHPVLGGLAEGFQALTTKTSGWGLTLGLVGAAIGIVTWAASALGAEQAKEKARLEEIKKSLSDSYDGYVKLAAEQAKSRAPGGMGTAAALVTAGGLQEQFRLTADETKKIMSALTQGATPESAAGYARGLAGGRAPLEGPVYQAERTEMNKMLAGTLPGAGVDAALEAMAARETAEGRGRSPEHIKDWLKSAVRRAHPRDIQAAQAAMEAFEGLGDLPVAERGTITLRQYLGTHYHQYDNPAGQPVPSDMGGAGP